MPDYQNKFSILKDNHIEDEIRQIFNNRLSSQNESKSDGPDPLLFDDTIEK